MEDKGIIKYLPQDERMMLLNCSFQIPDFYQGNTETEREGWRVSFRRLSYLPLIKPDVSRCWFESQISLVPRDLLVKHNSSQSSVLVQDFVECSKSQMDNAVPMTRIKQRLKHPLLGSIMAFYKRTRFITNVKGLCDVQLEFKEDINSIS